MGKASHRRTSRPRSAPSAAPLPVIGRIELRVRQDYTVDWNVSGLTPTGAVKLLDDVRGMWQGMIDETTAKVLEKTARVLNDPPVSAREHVARLLNRPGREI